METQSEAYLKACLRSSKLFLTNLDWTTKSCLVYGTCFSLRHSWVWGVRYREAERQDKKRRQMQLEEKRLREAKRKELRKRMRDPNLTMDDILGPGGQDPSSDPSRAENAGKNSCANSIIIMTHETVMNSTIIIVVAKWYGKNTHHSNDMNRSHQLTGPLFRVIQQLIPGVQFQLWVNA